MQNRGRKRVRIFFSSLFIFLLHLPFSFAKLKEENAGAGAAAGTVNIPIHNEMLPVSELEKSIAANSVYDSLKLGSIGLSKQVFDYAIRGFNYLKEKGKIANQNIITIADLSK